LSQPPLTTHAATIFDGLPPDALDRILGRLTRRHFASGTIVIAEGDRLHEMYIVEAGVADVTVADRRGSPHHVLVVPGDVLGEMSLFTGRAASATVRALEDLTVTVVTEAEFHDLGDAFPRLYQNLGAIVSRKLYHARSAATGYASRGGDRGAM
jgi:CRP-like cAMP-binding protein